MTSSSWWSYSFSQHRDNKPKLEAYEFVGLQHHDSLRVLISAGMTWSISAGGTR
jgi:hypothetical protein